MLPVVPQRNVRPSGPYKGALGCRLYIDADTVNTLAGAYLPRRAVGDTALRNAFSRTNGTRRGSPPNPSTVVCDEKGVVHPWYYGSHIK